MLIHQEISLIYQLIIFQQLMTNMHDSIGSFFLIIIKYYEQAIVQRIFFSDQYKKASDKFR